MLVLVFDLTSCSPGPLTTTSSRAPTPQGTRTNSFLLKILLNPMSHFFFTENGKYYYFILSYKYLTQIRIGQKISFKQTNTCLVEIFIKPIIFYVFPQRIRLPTPSSGSQWLGDWAPGCTHSRRTSSRSTPRWSWPFSPFSCHVTMSPTWGRRRSINVTCLSS